MARIFATAIAGTLATALGISRLGIIFGEKLPWTNMAVVHTMKHDAHAFASCKERGNTKHEADGREDTPRTTSVAESDQDGSDKAAHNASNTKATSEDDTGLVSVADRPADEVWMSLVTKRPFDSVKNIGESTRMRSDSKGV